MLENCLGRPIISNSVLKGLSIRRFADIHGETSATALARKETFSRNLLDEKEMKN
jgi:hypothetical protein